MSREGNIYKQLDSLSLEELLIYAKTLNLIPTDLIEYIVDRQIQEISQIRGKLNQGLPANKK